MKKIVTYGITLCLAVFIFAAIVYTCNPQTNVIKGDVFSIKDWNHPEYIEINSFVINNGVVIKEMPSKGNQLYNYIVEIENPYINAHYLVYFIDTTKHNIKDIINNVSVIDIGTYDYEESVDNIRRMIVYMSNTAADLYR